MSFFVASSEIKYERLPVRVARPRRSSLRIAAGQRLQRGPDLQHFFLVLTRVPLGTPRKLSERLGRPKRWLANAALSGRFKEGRRGFALARAGVEQ